MPVVFALFDDLEAADDVVAALSDTTGSKRAVSVAVHRNALDDLHVPSGATEMGKLLYIAVGAGGLIGLVGGLVAGGVFSIPGMGAGMGAGLGLVTGILLGALCGLMAGARTLKAPLAATVAKLCDGRALLVAEVEADELERVALAFEAGEPLEIDDC